MKSTASDAKEAIQLAGALLETLHSHDFDDDLDSTSSHDADTQLGLDGHDFPHAFRCWNVGGQQSHCSALWLLIESWQMLPASAVASGLLESAANLVWLELIASDSERRAWLTRPQDTLSVAKAIGWVDGFTTAYTLLRSTQGIGPATGEFLGLQDPGKGEGRSYDLIATERADGGFSVERAGEIEEERNMLNQVALISLVVLDVVLAERRAFDPDFFDEDEDCLRGIALRNRMLSSRPWLGMYLSSELLPE